MGADQRGFEANRCRWAHFFLNDARESVWAGFSESARNQAHASSVPVEKYSFGRNFSSCRNTLCLAWRSASRLQRRPVWRDSGGNVGPQRVTGTQTGSAQMANPATGSGSTAATATKPTRLTLLLPERHSLTRRTPTAISYQVAAKTNYGRRSQWRARAGVPAAIARPASIASASLANIVRSNRRSASVRRPTCVRAQWAGMRTVPSRRVSSAKWRRIMLALATCRLPCGCSQAPLTKVCAATIRMTVVLPHPGMLPSGSSIASPECSRRHVSLSIEA